MLAEKTPQYDAKSAKLWDLTNGILQRKFIGPSWVHSWKDGDIMGRTRSHIKHQEIIGLFQVVCGANPLKILSDHEAKVMLAEIQAFIGRWMDSERQQLSD